MTVLETLLLLGIAPLLILAIVLVAEVRGAFRRDALADPLRKALALGLLYTLLVVLVILPAAGAVSGPVDVSQISFWQVFNLHFLMVLFLACWWALAGAPDPRVFLGLAGGGRLRALKLGVRAGLLGWGLTLVTGVASQLLVRLLGNDEDSSMPPLVGWIAALAPWQKVLVVLSAMTVEEVLFRGFLQPRVGAASATILFLLVHSGYGDPLYLVGLLPISIVLASLYEETQGTLAPMVAHGVFDAIQLFVVLPLATRIPA